MPLFAAGQRLTAQVLNNAFPASAGDAQDTPGTVTSTAYTAIGLSGGTVCSVVFTAPTSGAVMIDFAALLTNSTTQFTYTSPQIRTGATPGAGTVVVAAADEYALTNFSTNQLRWGGSLRVSGLTPGTVYNCQTLVRVTGGTGTVSRKRLAVSPLT